MSLAFQPTPFRRPPFRSTPVDLAGFFDAVADAAAGQRPLEAVLAECVQAMVDRLGAGAAFVWTVSDDRRWLQLAAGRGVSRDVLHVYDRLPAGLELPGAVVLTGESTVADLWSAAAPCESTWARRRGLRTFLAYPLRLETTIVGVVGLYLWHDAPAAVDEAVRACLPILALAAATPADRSEPAWNGRPVAARGRH